MADEQRGPLVGVGVLLMAPEDNTWLSKRLKGTRGVGKLNAPGGHWEGNEDGREAALREVFEETGISASKSSLVELGWTDNAGEPDYLKDGHPIVLTYWMALWIGDVIPQRMEPNKLGNWQKYDGISITPDDSKLFGPVRKMMRLAIEKAR